jgi:hypothetical protein
LFSVIALPEEQHVDDAAPDAAQAAEHGGAELDCHGIVQAVLEKFGVVLAHCPCVRVR